MTSLKRNPEPLWFNRSFHLSCHGLNQWSNITCDEATSSQASDTMVHSSVLFLERRTGNIFCIVLFTSLHIFLMGFISDAHGAKSTSLMSVCSDSHSWTTRKSWSGGLDGTGLFQWDKTFLQRALLFCKMCLYWRLSRWPSIWWAFQPLHGRSSLISEQTEDYCMWRQTYTVSCNTLPMVCKLKPAHHLLS
jgi:hypothetical protein